MTKEYTNKWIYKNKVFESEDINGAHGFIYLIKEKSSGRYYIGQKHFWTRKVRSINKKKKKVKVESDWKHYYSSSNYINENVKNETQEYERMILALVDSDGMLNYIEAKLQMDLRVIEHSDIFINGYIGGRMSTNHYNIDKLIDVDLNLINMLYTLTYTGFLRNE